MSSEMQRTSSETDDFENFFQCDQAEQGVADSNSPQQLDVHQVLLQEQYMDHNQLPNSIQDGPYSRSGIMCMSQTATDEEAVQGCSTSHPVGQSKVRTVTQQAASPTLMSANLPSYPRVRRIVVPIPAPASALTQAQTPTTNVPIPVLLSAADHSARAPTEERTTGVSAGNRRKISSSPIEPTTDTDEARAARKREGNRRAAERSRLKKRRALEDAEAKVARLTMENQILRTAMHWAAVPIPDTSHLYPDETGS